MTNVRMTMRFEAPIERVFELGTDYGRYPEWNVSYDGQTRTGCFGRGGGALHEACDSLLVRAFSARRRGSDDLGAPPRRDRRAVADSGARH